MLVGRLGKASVAAKLFLETDENKAMEFAIKLNELNTKRQNIEKEIFDSAINMIENVKENKEKNSIILYNENWHNGVIGIVSSRLVSIYNKPVILFTKENGVIRGSGRCQKGFSLYDALTVCKDYLIQFGGHELAAGMSIEEEKIPDFYDAFEEYVKSSNIVDRQEIDVDFEITKEDLNVSLLKDIYSIRPFGQSNPEPLFLYRNLKIQAIRTLKEEKHIKFVLKDDKYLIEALGFSKGHRRDEFRLSDKLDVICNVELNTFNTPKTIQLVLEDFKKTI